MEMKWEKTAEGQCFHMKSLGLWSQNAEIWIPTPSPDKVHDPSLNPRRAHSFPSEKETPCKVLKNTLCLFFKTTPHPTAAQKTDIQDEIQHGGRWRLKAAHGIHETPAQRAAAERERLLGKQRLRGVTGSMAAVYHHKMTGMLNGQNKAGRCK